VRGSNVDATLYYLARMIDAGEDQIHRPTHGDFASEILLVWLAMAPGLALNAFKQSSDRHARR